MAARDVSAGAGFDILVSNAGLIRRADAVAFSDTDWDEVVDVNAKALFFTCQAFARELIARGGAPEDIAGTAVCLCSAAADYVHGAVLNVDGGWLAR